MHDVGPIQRDAELQHGLRRLDALLTTLDARHDRSRELDGQDVHAAQRVAQGLLERVLRHSRRPASTWAALGRDLAYVVGALGCLHRRATVQAHYLHGARERIHGWRTHAARRAARAQTPEGVSLWEACRSEV